MKNFYDEQEIGMTQGAVAQDFMSKVYAWMASALGITALVAWYIANYQLGLVVSLAQNNLMWLVFIIQIGLVIYLSAAIHKMSAQTAIIVFYLYAASVGLTFSVLFLVFTAASLASTFVITAGTFGAMAIYGYTTKNDLTSVGSFLFMALIGLILTSIVNIFLQSSGLYWITTFLGLFIFIGLTAYDSQKIKHLAIQLQETESDHVKKMAIMGALTLYLDFINLFLYLLRLFGHSRD